MPPRISLVVPAYNEAKLLPQLLDSVDAARARFPGEVEVIVADNVSTDATARIAADRGCRVATVTTRVIGAVRNGGAKLATGDILAFVDADSRIHRDALVAIAAAMADPRIAGGSTGATLDRWSAGLAVTYAALAALANLTGIDTGVVFVRREDFERLGGYDESLRVAEDVAWLWKLKRDGRKRGRRLVRLRNVKTFFSTRKFDQHGDWHYFRMPWEGLKLLLRRGRSSAELERYWYEPDR
jgi:glycosyltransferase involved in cell wall biosynthesis